jgi:hypothetical protein
MLVCLNILSQHSHGENKEKYVKPQSGYVMTQIYCQGVKVTMHISIASVNLYSSCIAPLPIYSSVAWCLEMRAVLPPNLEKRLLFIVHMDKVINNSNW